MLTFQIIYILSMTLFVGYLTITIAKFGLTKSYSNFYYLWESCKPGWGMSFYIVNILLVFGVMIVGLQLSKDSEFQFLAFLFPAALAFVAAAPRFMERFEGLIHRISAISCATTAVLWCVLVAKLWWLIPIAVLLMLVLALVTRTLRSSLTFWAEMAAFFATFTSMGLMLFCR